MRCLSLSLALTLQIGLGLGQSAAPSPVCKDQYVCGINCDSPDGCVGVGRDYNENDYRAVTSSGSIVEVDGFGGVVGSTTGAPSPPPPPPPPPPPTPLPNKACEYITCKDGLIVGWECYRGDTPVTNCFQGSNQDCPPNGPYAGNGCYDLSQAKAWMSNVSIVCQNPDTQTVVIPAIFTLSDPCPPTVLEGDWCGTISWGICSTPPPPPPPPAANVSDPSLFALFTKPQSFRPGTSGGPGGVCNCHDSTIEWRSMLLPVSSPSAQSFAAGLPNLGSGFAADRCTMLTVGYSWSLAGEDTDPIVLTIPPGDFVPTALHTAGLSAQALNSGITLNGQPCGQIFQDPLQGLVAGVGDSGASLSILPSAIPSSLYCSFAYGSTTRGLGLSQGSVESENRPTSARLFRFLIRQFGAIDAVCQCRLGNVGALLMFSGVYFIDNEWTHGLVNGPTSFKDKATHVFTTYNYIEPLTNRHPMVFPCREAHVVYMLLYLFVAGTPYYQMLIDGKNVSTNQTLGLYNSFSSLKSEADYSTVKDYLVYGQYYPTNTDTGFQALRRSDMLKGSRFAQTTFIQAICGSLTNCTSDKLMQIATKNISAELSNLIVQNCNTDWPKCSATSDDAYNVLVETLAFYFRWAMYERNTPDFEAILSFVDAIVVPAKPVCTGLDVMSEWRFREDNSISFSDAQFVTAKLINFTFFRGSIPTSRLRGMAGGFKKSNALEGWDPSCTSCYYSGECVPTGSTCCDGSSGIATPSATCPQVCAPSADGVCFGFPVAFRHTPPPPPLAFSSGTVNLDNCTSNDFELWAAAAGDSTASSEIASKACRPYWPQPVRASPFVDVSKLGSFFTDTAPFTFFSTLTSFYGTTLSRLFSLNDINDDSSGGRPAGNTFDTLTMTYERFSGDLTYTEATRLEAAWDFQLIPGQCQYGGCFNALDNATLETLRSVGPSNETVFEEDVMFSGDGLSLLSALVRLYQYVDPSFYKQHFFSKAGPLRYPRDIGLASEIDITTIPLEAYNESTLSLGTLFDFCVRLNTVGPLDYGGKPDSRLYLPTGLPPSVVDLGNFVSLLFDDSDQQDASLWYTVSNGINGCIDPTDCPERCISKTRSPDLRKPRSAWVSDCPDPGTDSLLVANASTGLFGRGMALAQSLSILSAATGSNRPVSFGTRVQSSHAFFSADSVPELSAKVASIELPPGLGYCWSGRFVGDVARALGGLCVTPLTSRCFFAMSSLSGMTYSTTTQRLGCLDNSSVIFNATSDSTVKITGIGGIEWDTPLPPNASTYADSGWQCWASLSPTNTTRFCTFDPVRPGNYPMMLTSESRAIVRPTPAPAITASGISQTPEMLYASLCGCSNIPVAGFELNDTVSLLRDPSTRACTVESCVGTSCTDSSLYRCGSVSAPILSSYDSANAEYFQLLCQKCPANQVGQCAQVRSNKIVSCVSYNWTTLECPAGYEFCGDTPGLSTFDFGMPASGALTGETSLYELTARNPTNFMWQRANDTGPWYDLLPKILNRSRILWDITPVPPLDGVNCVYTSKDYTSSLEQPRYLKPPFVPPTPGNLDDPPTGLTVDELEAWCRAAIDPHDCSFRSKPDGRLPNRAKLCVFNETTNQCELRTLLQEDYDVYAPGKARFSTDTHPIVYPLCFLWVPEIDAVSECTNAYKFTGCVLSSTSRANSTHLTTEPEMDTANGAASLFFPLITTEMYAGIGYNENAVLQSFFIHAFIIRTVDTCDVLNSSVVNGSVLQVGYWSTSGTPRFQAVDATDFTVVAGAEPHYCVLRASTPIESLGLPVEDTDRVLSTIADIRGINRGLRASLVGLPAGFVHVGFNANTANQQHLVSTSALARMMVSCVPLTFRVKLDAASMPSMVASNLVYRRRPMDCAILASNAITNSQPEVAQLFKDGGPCDSASGSQLTFVTIDGGDADNSVATATNARFFTGWYDTLTTATTSPPDPGLNNGIIFYDTASGFSSVTIDGFDMAASLRSSGWAPGTDWEIGALPTCTASASPGQCAVAIDKTSLVPCTGMFSTTVAACQKPTMYNLFPRYIASDPTADSGAFPYPVNLMKYGEYSNASQAGTDYVKASSSTWWDGPPWNSYLAMVHYCDFYFKTPDNPDGRPVYCDNDPLSLQDRIDFCKTYKPQFVFAGLVVNNLPLTELCPFLSDNIPNAGQFMYCFVFSDHPTYNTIQSFLSAKLPAGLTWTGVSFYYVPFTMRVLKLMLTLASVSDTLITNHADASTFRRLTTANFEQFGPAGIQIFSKLASAVSGDGRKTSDLDNLCLAAKPLTLDLIKLVYDITVLSGNGEGSYTFTELGGTTSTQLSTVTLSTAEVFGLFGETSTLLEYDDLEVTTAVPGVPAVIGIPTEVTINNVPTCTRFQVNGNGVSIHGVRFDQSKCTLTGSVSQTPIVFSGAFASNSRVYDIVVVDTAAAVAVLGGNSIVYTFEPVIAANGMVIHDVDFEYTPTTTVPASDRYVVAVFAKTIGVPMVSACFRGGTPPSFRVLANCVWQLTDMDLLNQGLSSGCTATSQCVTAGSPVCCSPLDKYVADPDCSVGFRCGTKSFPNSQELCNVRMCNCDTASTCADAIPGTAFTPALTTGVLACSIPAVGLPAGTGYPFRAFDGRPVHVVQEFQFYSGGGVWYAPTESYYSTFVDTTVTFVRGIGFRETLITIAGAPQQSISLAKVVAASFSTTVSPSSPLSTSVTVIPSDQVSSDSVQDIAGLDIQLQLSFDRTIASPQYSSSLDGFFTEAMRTEISTTTWCIGAAHFGAPLTVEPCANSTSRWYLDPVTYRIHPSQDPRFCLSTLPPATDVFLLPCRPCAHGTETLVETATTGSAVLVFWLDAITLAPLNATTTDGTVVPTALLNGSDVVILYDDLERVGQSAALRTLGIAMNTTSGACFVDGGGTTPPGFGVGGCPIRTLGAQPLDSNLGQRGIFQSLSSGGLGGPLYSVQFDDVDGCPTDVPIRLEASTSRNGRGAIIQLTESTQDSASAPASHVVTGADGQSIRIDILAGGFGYTSSTLLVAPDYPGQCSGKAITIRVEIQPYGSEAFDIETGNVELVNVTAYTSRFGQGHLYTASSTRVSLSQLLEFAVVLLSVLCALALAVNIVFIVYRWVLTRRIENDYASLKKAA